MLNALSEFHIAQETVVKKVIHVHISIFFLATGFPLVRKQNIRQIPCPQ